MSWVKLDDKMPGHPKIGRLSHRAFRLFIELLCWCSKYETDGIFPDAKVVYMERRAAALKELVAGGVVEEVEDGYAIHDYLDYQPSKVENTANRSFARRRQAMHRDSELARDVKARDEDRCRYCGKEVNWRDRRGALGGTYDHVIPITQGGGDSLENLVVSCRSCNSRKRDRTPEEASMPLLPEPEPGADLGTTQVITSRPDPDPSPVPIRSDPPLSERAMPEPSMTPEQQRLLDHLAEEARSLMGADAPPHDWCGDLVRRGATLSDIDYAVNATRVKEPRVVKPYLRSILEDRVKQREAGHDPDADGERAHGGAGAAGRGRDGAVRRSGQLAPDAGRRDAASGGTGWTDR